MCRVNHQILFFLIAALTIITCNKSLPQEDPVLHFSVYAGTFRRIDTPVSLEVENLIRSDTLFFRLFENTKKGLIEKHLQTESGYINRLWFILDGITEPGEKREFFLFKSKSASDSKTVVYTEISPDALVLKKGKSEILRYQTALKYPPVGVDTIYKRNGFIHPLLSPAGNILTRINPPDHYHHLGIWNPWTKVSINGHVTDFWNLYENQGTVRFEGINSLSGGPVYGGFSVRQQHFDFLGKSGNDLVLNEVWHVIAWNSEPVEGIRCYIIDFTSFLTSAVNCPIIFEAYRYGGGIGFRATEKWTNTNSTILTSEGKTRIDADGSRAKWADINGVFSSGSNSGLIIMSHPSNRQHPEPMRVWPPDANNGKGDVFFEFCPIRYKEWIIEPGNVYRLKYRIILYDGKVRPDTAERLWNDFASPPEIRIEGND